MLRTRLFVTVVSLLVTSTAALAQTLLGTAFTYQGQLHQFGVPANGTFPMVFKLWNAASGGTQIGPTLTFDGVGGNPATVSVANGLFNVSLDFGTGAFGANARWLEATVDGTPLTPRTRVSPAPAAIFSAAPWTTSGSTVSYLSGNVGLSADRYIGADANYNFNYSGKSMGYTALGWFIDPWNTNGPTAWLSGLQGIKFFTQNQPRMAIASDGRVGIGTTTPSRILEVRGLGDTEIGIKSDSTNGRLWTLQSSDGGPAGQTPGTFQIIDRTLGFSRMTIDTGGHVGIGTTAPEQPLHVIGDVRIDSPNNNDVFLWFGGPNESTDPVRMWRDSWGNDLTRFTIQVGDNPGALGDDLRIVAGSDTQFIFGMDGQALKTGFPVWGVVSDARAKHDIEPLRGVLNQVLRLKGRTFLYNEPNKPGTRPGKCTGFIAQEVEGIFPEWVGTDPSGMKNMHIAGFEALTVESLRELRAEKDTEIAALRAEKDAQIRDLTERLARLEAMITESGRGTRAK